MGQMEMLVSRLSSEVDAKNKHLKEMENKYNEASLSLSQALEEKEKLHGTYLTLCRAFEEKEMMHRNYMEERKRVEWTFNSLSKTNMMLNAELDSVRKELAYRCYNGSQANEKLMAELESVKKELEYRTYHGTLANQNLKKEVESLRKNLEHQKNGLEDNISLDGHEIEKVHTDAEEVKNSSSKGKSQVRTQIEESDWEIPVMNGSNQESEEPEFLNTLIMKERISNCELQEARKELIKGLESFPSSQASIRIKRMGEIDERPFYKACLKRFSNEEVDLRSVELISLWQEHINNPQWHPFRITTIEGNLQEIVDDNDQRLNALRTEWGVDVYNSVVATLLEINEYNPSGRYTVPELWNFKDGKRASLKEAIHFLFEQMKHYRDAKRRKLAAGSSRA